MSLPSKAKIALADVEEFLNALEEENKTLSEEGHKEYKRLAQRVIALEQELRDESNKNGYARSRMEELKSHVERLKVSNETLRRQLANAQAHKPERTCPTPGGCESCPRPTWCQLMRLKLSLTSREEEEKFHREHDMDWVLDVSIVDHSTPMEANHEEG